MPGDWRGPTGVELAGAIAELARRALAADFREIDPKQTRVLLLEAGPRLLPNFPESLSRYTAAVLVKLGVEVHLGAPVTDCGPEDVTVGNERIPAATILWAAGGTASPAAAWLARDRAGRVPVGPSLTAPGHDNIYVIGDNALVRGAGDTPLPGIAPVAKQQGAHVARSIAARIYFLVSMRNRVIVMTQWLWSYLKFERGARLITGLKLC